MSFPFTQRDLSDFYQRLNNIYSQKGFDITQKEHFEQLQQEYSQTCKLHLPENYPEINQVFIIFTTSRANLRIRPENMQKENAATPHATFVEECQTPIAVEVAPEEPLRTERHEYHYHHYHETQYRSDNSNFWFWMYFIESMKPREHAPQKRTHRSSFPSENQNQSESNTSTSSWIPLVFITGGAAFLAYVTFYYVTAQWLDSIERLIHNEGKGVALLGLSLMSAVAGFSAYFLVLPIQQSILAMALTAGLPSALALVLAVFVALCAHVIFSFLGMVVTQKLQQFLFNYTAENDQTLDDRDPERFRLTVEEEQHLKVKHYDPTVVKCAIVELLLQMDRQAKENSKVSTYSPSLFTPLSQYQREQIKLIRGLRAGDERAMKKVLNLRAEDSTEKAEFNFSDDVSNPQSFAAINQPSAPMG